MNIKKISYRICMIVLMIIGMSTTVLATPSIEEGAPTKGSITIIKPGASFMSYQVLQAVQSGDAYVYTATTAFQQFFENPTYGNYTIKGISQMSEQEEKKQLAAYLHQYVLDKNIVGSSLESNVKKEVALGYYLVRETSSASNGEAVASTAILVSVPTAEEHAWKYHVTIQPKDHTPSLEKKIIQTVHGVPTASDSSTANIKDMIHFQVDASIPTYEIGATNIKYTFEDTMSKGFTYDSATGIKVTSGSKIFEKDKDYTVQVNNHPDGTTTLMIDFVYEKIKAYSNLTLQYQAELNEHAIISSEVNEGNVNRVQLTYTNNPFVSNSYKTLEDKVKTYTWGLGVKKVDAESITTDLAGAEFVIKNAEGTILATYTYDASGNVVVTSGKAVTGADGMLYFVGLKDGEYTIQETKAPSGYRLLETPVKVNITAKKDHNDHYTGEADIVISNGNTAGSIVNQVTMKDGNVLFQVQIKNYKGISLPGTGGIGTQGFMIVGGVLMMSSICLFSIAELKKRRR